MLFLETAEGFKEWKGEVLPDPDTGDLIQHFPTIAGWDPAELARWNLYIPVSPPVPEGKLVVSKTVARVDGVVTFIYDLVDVVVTKTEVWAERDRRLEAGFDFDFGDARGVHRINTTPGDMIGWDAVTKIAQAQLNIKAVNPGFELVPIQIATGSGFANISPIEWQLVLLAAGAFQQPIWAASFLLEAADPIPLDFRDDAYWLAPTQE